MSNHEAIVEMKSELAKAQEHPSLRCLRALRRSQLVAIDDLQRALAELQRHQRHDHPWTPMHLLR